jgi:hypothetical protein
MKRSQTRIGALLGAVRALTGICPAVGQTYRGGCASHFTWPGFRICSLGMPQRDGSL